MERIHKKSALADTSTLLLAAHDLGTELLWGRYEQQLPLCAFTSNGLNCRKCFQGPCRINPFGDEPSRGVCGADRDQIVMENLFQTTLEGVMESARAVQLLGMADTEPELPDISGGLPRKARERLSRAGLLPIRKADLFSVQNSFFSHRGYLLQTLRDLTRLGLIHYAFLSQAASVLARSGKGPGFRPEGINLLIVGQPSAELVEAVERQAAHRAERKPVNLFTQGAHASPQAMAAADHGSPELALGMDVDAVIVAPNGSWPGIEALAAKYGIPVTLVDGGKSATQTASEAVDQAVRHSQTAFYGSSTRTIRPGRVGDAKALPREDALKQALQSGRVRGVVLLFGEANAKQTFFERTLALMEAAVDEKALVLLGGDLGSQADALAAELARRRGGQLAAFASELAQDGLHPIASFGSAFDFPAVVSLLNSLGAAGGDGTLPVVIAFPEFFRAATWAGAVSLFSLGFAVQIGARLPFWGSPWLAEAIQAEWPKITGGTLLAGPALPEARAQAEELTAGLQAGRAR